MAMSRAPRALLLLAGLQVGPRAAAALSTRAGGQRHVLDLDTLNYMDLGTAMDLDLVDAMDSVAGSDSSPSEDGDHGEEREAAKAKINFSPEKRKAAHDYNYVADFWVYLNMTYAEEKELPLGIVLHADEEWIPVKIERVKKNGLMQMWNDGNPDKQVLVNDQIVQVNGIVFHANSRTFADHVANQFKAGRKGLEGAKRTLSLHVLRERPELKNPLGEGRRTSYQRFDAHKKQYPKEFTVKLPVPKDAGSSATAALGMRFNYWAGHNWLEPWIETILPGGMIAKWNEEHPEDLILEGDEITKVSNRNFGKDRKAFMGYVEKKFAQAKHDTENVLELYIRRPNYVQDMYDRLPSRDEVVESTEEAAAMLPIPAAKPLPMLFGTASPDQEPKEVRSFWGLDAVESWNDKNPEKKIKLSDQVVGLTWQAAHGGQVNVALQRNLRKVNVKNRLLSTSRVKAKLQIPGPRDASKLNVTSSSIFGWNITCDGRFEPVQVTSLSKTGLIAKWNAGNPDQAIGVDDYIISINGIPWRMDSPRFIELIENQFIAGQAEDWQEGRITIVAQKALKKPETLPQDSAPMVLTSSPKSDTTPHAPEPDAGKKEDEDEGWVGSDEDEQ